MRGASCVLREALKGFWDELLLPTVMNIVAVRLVVPVITRAPALAVLRLDFRTYPLAVLLQQEYRRP